MEGSKRRRLASITTKKRNKVPNIRVMRAFQVVLMPPRRSAGYKEGVSVASFPRPGCVRRTNFIQNPSEFCGSVAGELYLEIILVSPQDMLPN